MNINSHNVYDMLMSAADKMREPEVKSDKLKLIGNKNQIEYWKTFYGDRVEYIQVDNFIKW